MKIVLILTFLLTFNLLAQAEKESFKEIKSEIATVDGVSLGDSDEKVISIFGNPSELKNESPQFGTVEKSYYYDGFYAHTTDGRVESMIITSNRFSLPNGITVGTRVSELKEMLDLEWGDEGAFAYIGKSNACFIHFNFNEERVSKIDVYCAG
jgi:hypothetical protein